MREEHKIVKQVLTAKQSSALADDFIRQYMPFIKAETAKFIKRSPQEGQDEELNIAMFAFYESMCAYEQSKGSFLNLASIAIRNRLIDFYRREQRHTGVIYYDQTVSEEDTETTLLDGISDQKDEYEDLTHREATQAEIAEFSAQLETFGLSLTDVADSCPKQERTLKACLDVLAFAKEHPQLLDQLVASKKLPINALAMGSGVEKKTLERHRKYLVAILLAYTNGYEIIRGHLYQLKR